MEKDRKGLSCCLKPNGSQMRAMAGSDVRVLQLVVDAIATRPGSETDQIHRGLPSKIERITKRPMSSFYDVRMTLG